MSYAEIKYTRIARKLLKSIYEGCVTLLDIKAFNKADNQSKVNHSPTGCEFTPITNRPDPAWDGLGLGPAPLTGQQSLKAHWASGQLCPELAPPTRNLTLVLEPLGPVTRTHPCLPVGWH